MARKKYPNQAELPGLFDDFEVTLPSKEYPIHPDIARHAQEKKQEESLIETPLEKKKEAERLLFMSFGSGSSGNCAYLGTYSEGILIDAGVDVKHVLNSLAENKIPIESVKGIFLTHDHGDHIRQAYPILRKYKHIALYCTPKTLNGILRKHSVSRRIKDRHSAIYIEHQYTVGGLTVTPFTVSHDGTDNVGYHIVKDNQTFTIATDLGCTEGRLSHYASTADYLMLESNYDRRMLINGTYAEQLKARILKDTGHLDNAEAARFVSENYHENLSHVFLCHLSNDNNTPEIAINTMTTALRANGLKVGDDSESIASREADVRVIALPRFESSRLFILRKD